MHNKYIIFLIIIIVACSRNSGVDTSRNLLTNKSWRTYEYQRNGIPDAGVVAQQPTFQFRSDSKLYFSQISPAFRDTLNYQFTSDRNIKLTRPGINVYINLKIDRLTDNDFDFTMIDSQTPTVNLYKTTRQ